MSISLSYLAAFVVAIQSAVFASGTAPAAGHAPREYRLIRPEGGIPDGFAWQKEPGPDSVVFRAMSREEPEAGFGMYVGLHPSFKGADASCKRAGFVAGLAVRWCPEKPNDEDSSATFVQTLLEYSPCDTCLPLQLHIWVGAPTHVRLEELLAGLGSAKFSKE